MRGLGMLLAWLAFVGGIIGIGAASQATLGVALLAGCCLLAIFARMAQASAYHREIRQLLRERREPLLD